MEKATRAVADTETGRPEPNPPINAAPEPDARSVKEFRAAHGISHSQVYEEIRTGRLVSMLVGKRRLISREAAASWRRRMERVAGEQAAAKALLAAEQGKAAA